MMRSLLRRMFVISLVGTISACSGLGGTTDDEENGGPAPLPDFETTLKLDKVWSYRGDGAGEYFIKLLPAVESSHIFVTDISGKVTALNSQTGKTEWHTKLKEDVTSGIGAGFGKLFLGTRRGKIIALNQEDGSSSWSAVLSSEILSVPSSNGKVVVVHAANEKIYGLDHKTGEQLWSYESVLPSLTLRGTANPATTNNIALVGLANGKLVALDIDSGRVLWDKRISVPQGRSELDRMTDIDGDPLLAADMVYVTALHGKVSAIELSSSRVKWQNDLSSFQGVDEGLANIYVVDTSGHIHALDQNTGNTVWKQSDLAHRGLTAPATMGNYLVVGDSEGYLHLLSQIDGQFLARKRVDSEGILSKPLTAGGLLYVLGNSGRLSAYRIN